MGRLFAAIYDWQMREVERACLAAWRGELLGQAAGRVLEIGAGTGANLPYYPLAVDEIVLDEPDEHMRRKLEARAAAMGRKVSIRAGGAEAIQAQDGELDCVVSTLVLCSVSHPEVALAEIRRVLKPGGSLLFVEHVGAAAGTARERWQQRLEPLWKRIAGNCHLTRDTEAVIAAAGFTFERIEHASLRKAMPLVRPSIRGIARRT